nr:unnamed protein product [Callosobruchus analis]
MKRKCCKFYTVAVLQAKMVPLRSTQSSCKRNIESLVVNARCTVSDKNGASLSEQNIVSVSYNHALRSANHNNPVGRTKSTKNGLLISCKNSEDLLTLKNDLQADISNTYRNYELPKNLVKQSSSDSKVELVDDFIDKPIFDNKLICTQRDLKVCTVLKNEKFEVLITIGYVSWVGLDVDSKSSFYIVSCFKFCKYDHFKKDCMFELFRHL